MRFYASWYPGDPVYADFDADCAMLVSATSVSKHWTPDVWSNAPKHLLIDSGAFRYALNGETPTQRSVFERQMRMIAPFQGDVMVCPLDYPLIAPNLTTSQADRLLGLTLANAYEFLLLAHINASRPFTPLAVVQGFDDHSVQHSARELYAMGYRHFGIGSLAMVYNGDQILRRVRAVIEIVGKGVHVFGVSSSRLARALEEIGVTSVDSSRPAKAALNNVVFSGPPFKRHRIAPTHGASPRSEYIKTAFLCPCSACGGRANPDLLKVGSRRYVYLRTLHNYYYLKQHLTNHAPTLPVG